MTVNHMKNNYKLQEKNEKIYSHCINLLSDEQKFKFWIKTLLSTFNNLPEIIKSVDKIIEIQASSISFMSDIYNTEKSTYSQVEKVIDLSERKNNLLNIYLVSKNLYATLNDFDREFIERKFVFNWTSEELAQEYGVSERTIFRRTEKIIDQIYESMKKKNWSLKFIVLQVKNENWIVEKFKKLVRDYFLSNQKLFEQEQLQ